MAEKMCAKRRAAFFTALRATGNQTVAAERAKVSRSWVRLHRTNDPAFRAEMEAAVAAARARLDGAASVGPAFKAWRDQDGVELTVRRANGRWRQVQRARLDQWTPRMEARFLRELAVSCNVLRACRAVGLSAAGAYGHRKRWPEFAEKWDAAIEEGYDRLSAALVASAGAMLGVPEMVPEAVMEGMRVDDAIRLLGKHRLRATGEGRLQGRPPRLRSFEELRPEILEKLTLGDRADRAAERRRKE